MMKTLTTIALLLLMAVSANAVPAKPVKKTLRTADGTAIEVTLCGDEHFSFYKDNNGNPFVLSEGRLQRISGDEVTAIWTQRRAEHYAASQTVPSTAKKAPRRVGTPSVTTGTHKGLVILMQFKNKSFVTQNVQSVFTSFFNTPGYNENGNAGSVRDFFLSQSYNQLTINFDVVGPFTTKYDMEYYGAHNGDSNDYRPQAMVAEGVDAAKKAGLNFADYDWDGDKVVDQVFVIYAGYGEAQTGIDDTIWPHESKLYGDYERTYDGVKIVTYGCSSELGGDGNLDGIGTACHEFSHCLGLPDMYDTKYKGGVGTSDWDVMCGGCYNNNSKTPAGYTSYERWFSKWMEPVEISSMTRINGMQPLASQPEAYILYNDKNHDEYYLLENRQLIGFDAGLRGHGLLVLHVDYKENVWTGNSVNNDPEHQRMSFVPADNKYDDWSLPGDPWPGTSGNTALTNYSTPAATTFNVNTDGRYLLSKPIDNITENTTNHTVSFVACRPELPVPAADNGQEQADGTSFKVTWPAVSGALGYQLELKEIGSAASDPSEALYKEFDFKKCQTSSVGYSDISTKLADYGLSNWTGSKLFTTPNKLRLGTSSATGYIQTPYWQVPGSQDLTVVIGSDIVKAGETVTGTLTYYYGNNGESAESESVTFTVTENKRHVFNYTIRDKQYFSLRIAADKQMYLNYLAVYDGTWTAEQLGINAASAPMFANTAKYFDTTTNSYTFTNLNPANRFLYRIRAKGEENTWSDWSEEKMFAFASSGIISVRPVDDDSPVRYYDLNGREVDASARGIIIVKQGNSVKKVVR